MPKTVAVAHATRFQVRGQFRLRRMVMACLGTAVLLAFGPGAGSATAAPVLKLDSSSPTHVQPGTQYAAFLQIRNVGDSPTAGTLSLAFLLPDETTAASASGPGWSCPGAAGATEVICTRTGVINPNHAWQNQPLVVLVNVSPEAAGNSISELTVSGGGATEVSAVDAISFAADLPGYGIYGFDGEVAASASGDPFTQAAGHPYSASTTIQVNSHVELVSPLLPPLVVPNEGMKDVDVELPPGLIGDPTGIPTCTEAQLAVSPPLCPEESQVGTIQLYTGVGGVQNAGAFQPIYNMDPPEDKPALFGFQPAGGTVVHLFARLRSGGDYGLSIDINNISQALAVNQSIVTFWGVPADSAFDAQRLCTGTLAELGCSSAAEPTAFLTNPTACTHPGTGLETRIRSNSWDGPSEFVQASFISHLPPTHPWPRSMWGPQQGPTGCDVVPFEPDVTVVPTTSRADSPTGLVFKLTVPQAALSDPAAIAQAHIKRAEVTLPEGVAVNPSSADGLESCSEDQIGLDKASAAECPESSKIGTVQIDTPLLDGPMDGSIYLAEQGTNPFSSLLALYIVAEGPGVVIKLPGKVEPDEDTGQVAVTFDDNPQLPFEQMRLRFRSGDRAPLVTPPTCGTYEVVSRFSPWSSADVDNPTPDEVHTSKSSFTIDKGPDGGLCKAGDANQSGDPADLSDRPFSPEMDAGLDNPFGGSFSPFVLRLTRQDGDQEILSTTVNPPKGLTAKLAGIPYCPEPNIAAGTCPEQSRIGTELAGAGAGSSPFYTTENPGSVYLAGPYKGAPLSMVIHDPVVAGPFDLKDITVRAAIHVDPRTAQLTVISDPIPQIVDGIPLRIRDLRIRMDRPDFTIAPTNCDPMQVAATVQGSHGATASLANRFQVGECASLGFNPKLKLDFGKSKKNTKRNAHPELNAKLSFNEGDANISSVEVALPQGVFLDQARLGRICSRANYAAETCPEESKVGYAKATTPLLDNPVEGPVYLKASDNPLPDLAADLNGQIDIDLFGKIDQKENKKGVNQIRNTFDVVPDVPVSDFQLTLEGGADGLLVNSQNICNSKRAQRVSIDMQAHNEMALSERPLVGSACKQINKKKAKRLKRKAKKLQRKAKQTKKKARKASGKKAKKLQRKAKSLKKKAREAKRQARKLR